MRNDIRSIKFSPDNRFFAVAADNGFMIWSLPDWNIYHEILNQKISDIAFSHDGKMFAVAEVMQVTLWSLESITPIALLKGKRLLADVDVMVFSPDGSMLAGGGFDGVLRLWDLRKLNEN